MTQIVPGAPSGKAPDRLPEQKAPERLTADQYVEIGKSASTERTYLSAVDHYRDVWQGQLPATSKAVANYIAHYGSEVALSTTRVRLAALSKWHCDFGYADPTKSQYVKAALKGISKREGKPQRQATPLTFDHMKVIFAHLENKKLAAINAGDHGEILRTHRDLALLAVGFWHGFRSDELSRLAVECIVADRAVGMTTFLPYSKTDTKAEGRTYSQRALRAYCPVDAYCGWIKVAGITRGPVFRKISRWGTLADHGIHKRSIEDILDRVTEGLFEQSPGFTTHSLRRGFAAWASEQGWDLKTLMEHVGWKSVASAQRYLPVRKSYGDLDLEAPKGHLPAPAGGQLEGPAGETFVASYQVMDDNG